jgi:ABC-type bacteriocin/lantibiotic exporter with double-glycine peptidase domain
MVSLSEEINKMPMGIHTVIPEGGSTLSGGQRQRLAIARALIGKPKILIFDEATSALDNPTQETITKSLESLNVTRIVIAHRLTTIKNADNIFVINNGKVVEEGNYQKLIKNKGLFTNLVKRQIT